MGKREGDGPAEAWARPMADAVKIAGVARPMPCVASAWGHGWWVTVIVGADEGPAPPPVPPGCRPMTGLEERIVDALAKAGGWVPAEKLAALVDEEPSPAFTAALDSLADEDVNFLEYRTGRGYRLSADASPP